jgi:hypothetical protein
MSRFPVVLTALFWIASFAHGQALETGPDGTPKHIRQARTSAIFDFTSAKSMTGWIVVNDGVMGGKSKGGFQLQETHVTFRGVTNTDGGGFSSIRGRLPDGADLAGADGLLIRLRTDGKRTFKVDLRQSSPARTRALAFRATIKTTDDEDWQEIKVPFSSFNASWRGQPVPSAKLNLAAATHVGFFVYDGQDGPFRLEIASVASYAD